MDFLDPKKKRAHNIRLYIGYGLMAVALGITTLVLVFAAYGYDIDRKTGGVFQNGLIVVDSHPESAEIFVNGANKGRTSNRLILPENDYEIELRRSGYKTWKKSIKLEGSTIEQLVYPFMYPEKLESKTLQAYVSAPTMASQSPDRKWLVIATAEVIGSFQLVDLGDKNHPATTITLPSDALTPYNGAHSISAVEWSTDNNHLLIMHKFGASEEFVLIDRGKPELSINLNKVFAGHKFTAVSLRDKKPDQFYLHDEVSGVLLSADIKSAVVTKILDSVKAYKSYESDTILYVTNPANSTNSILRLKQKTQTTELRTLPVSNNYMLDLAQFNDQLFVVAGSAADSRVYIYRNPSTGGNLSIGRTPAPFRVFKVDDAQFVSFSAIARFVAVQGGSKFVVYDIETNRNYKYDTKMPLSAGQKAVWMDGHRLILDSESTINVFDFDGTNMIKLSASLDKFTPFFDRDYSAIFSLAPDTLDKSKASLIRTELKVNPVPN